MNYSLAQRKEVIRWFSQISNNTNAQQYIYFNIVKQNDYLINIYGKKIKDLDHRIFLYNKLEEIPIAEFRKSTKHINSIKIYSFIEDGIFACYYPVIKNYFSIKISFMFLNKNQHVFFFEEFKAKNAEARNKILKSINDAGINLGTVVKLCLLWH